MHYVVSIKLATLAASTKAVLTTFVGSIIPFSLILTMFPVVASKPFSIFFAYKSFVAINDPSKPAFSAILKIGLRIDF